MTDRRLLRELGIVLIIKLLLLVALWWAFIRDARVPVDTDLAARSVVGASTEERTTPDKQGEPSGH